MTASMKLKKLFWIFGWGEGSKNYLVISFYFLFRKQNKDKYK